MRYLQLAHDRRQGGVTWAEVLLNLGREAVLDVEGPPRSVGAGVAGAAWPSVAHTAT